MRLICKSYLQRQQPDIINMATSLAAQLQKLRAPQTSLLHQDKKRPSLLFDPKEAANYDRQTIYELGLYS